MDSALIQSL